MKKLNQEINILIPDGENKLAIFVINCLSEYKNIKIHILSKFKWVEIRFSKNISSFTTYSELENERDWIEMIKSELIKRKITILFPVDIQSIELLSRYNNEFDGLVTNLVLPNNYSFNTSDNKWSLYKLLKHNNLKSPKTNHSDLIQYNESIDFPVIVKPIFGIGGDDIKKIDEKNSLIAYCKNKKNLIIQDYIKGFDIDMSVLCENGKILAYTIQKGFMFRNEKYKPALGIEFLFETEIYEVVNNLVTILDWTGLAHIDLRFDELKKEFVVIEVNPRIWGSIESSNKVGVNFPYLYCLTSLGIKYEIPEYRFQKCVNNTGLFKIILSKFHKGGMKYKYPENSTIKSDFLDPFPKIYKLVIGIAKNLLPKENKFLKRFKSDVF